MVGRLSSALVEGDPTGAAIPGRRLQTGLSIGVLLALLLVGGFAVYGWIVPGGSSAYRQDGVILVEKETGDRYVYVDGALHPTPDMASALLIKGSGAQVKLISKDSIKNVPRGYPMGVAGAPPRLPEPGALVSGPWLACLPGSVVPGSKTAGPGLDLIPGAPAAPLPAGGFTVVRARNNVPYVVTGQLRFRVADPAVLVALGAAAIDPPPAPNAWLGTLGAGPDLGPAPIPGAGDPGPEVGGKEYPIGALFRQRSDSGTDQLFVLRQDGLAPMSRTEFLFADAASPDAPVELDPAAVVGAARSADRSLLDRLPDLAALKPQALGGRALCVRQQAVSAQMVSTEVVLVDPAWSGVDSAGRATVLTPIGSGMVVTPWPATTAAGTKPPIVFISDQGYVHQVADDESAGALRLDAAQPVPFPSALLATMPQGPVLSRKAVTGLPRG